MKKKYLYSSAAALLLTLAGYQLGRYQEGQVHQDHKVAYIESKDSSTKADMSEKDLTPDEVSRREGIAAEQIVVKITDQGYVTSHGDHFHYYNGKVPYDALISEELILQDEAYVLNDADIVNEVKDGYIIKRNGQYYLYLTKKATAENVRTKAEIARQKEETLAAKPARDKSETAAASVYRTDDGYVFNPRDVIDDLGDGFLVPHGDHFHFIPKKDLSLAELTAAQNYWNSKAGSNQTGKQTVSAHDKLSSGVTEPAGHSGGAQSLATAPSEQSLSSLLAQLYAQPLSARHVEADGLVFDPQNITKRTGAGVVVPHGDHYHFIPYSQMSDLEARIARQIPLGSRIESLSDKPSKPAPQAPKPAQPTEPQRPQTSPKPSQDIWPSHVTKSHKGKDGRPYDTSDGYIFSADSILAYDKDGLRVKHGNHEHYIFYHELEDEELVAARAYILKKGISAEQAGDFSQADLAAKLQYVSLENGIALKDLQVTGNYVIIPHGNHSHTADLRQYPTKLAAANYDSLEDYQSLLLGLKMNYLKLQADVADFYRKDNYVLVTKTDGREEKIFLKDIGLPLVYEEVSFDDLVTAVSPYEEKLQYIAKQYGVSRHKVTHLYGNLVWIDGRYSVDLSLVNVKDPIIYSLRHKTAEDTEKPEQPQTKPAATGQQADLMAYLGDYYGDKASKISFIPGVGYVITPKAGEVNTILTEKEVLSSFTNQTALPELEQDEVTDEEDVTTDTPTVPNRQRVASPEELAAAKAAGRYTTSDGYIFDAKDIQSDEGDAYVVPHLNHSHWIPKTDLSESERQEAEAYVREKGLAKPVDQGKSSSDNQPETIKPSEKAEDVYARVAAAKRMPLEAVPYHMAYAVDFQNGRLIIPHYDHYHNIAVAWFDNLYEVPAGYTLEDLFATVKYYLAHPEERPGSDDGWGKDSDIASDSTSDTSEEDTEDIDDEEVEEDPFEAELSRQAELFQMPLSEFRQRLIRIAFRYHISLSDFSFQAETGTVSFNREGEVVTLPLAD